MALASFHSQAMVSFGHFRASHHPHLQSGLSKSLHSLLLAISFGGRGASQIFVPDRKQTTTTITNDSYIIFSP